MKILAIDSTSSVAASAICEDNDILSNSIINSGQKHSEVLLPTIEKQLKDTNMSISDIDIFTCSIGPGSFTGVRIGTALIKGLAFGGKVCIGVSSLEALAYNMRSYNGIISPVMDARRGQLYNALFRCKNGIIERLCDDRMIDIYDLFDELDTYSEDIYFTGDGYSFVFGEYESENKKETPVDRIPNNAGSVAMLALKEYKNGNYTNDRELKPIYLRLPQAERERLEKIDKEN